MPLWSLRKPAAGLHVCAAADRSLPRTHLGSTARSDRPPCRSTKRSLRPTRRTQPGGALGSRSRARHRRKGNTASQVRPVPLLHQRSHGHSGSSPARQPRPGLPAPARSGKHPARSLRPGLHANRQNSADHRGSGGKRRDPVTPSRRGHTVPESRSTSDVIRTTMVTWSLPPSARGATVHGK